MKQRPILFSTLMVQAILEGRKVQTRRVVKDGVPIGNWEETEKHCPYGKPGDVLWVREKWCRLCYVDSNGYTQFDDMSYYYAADGDHPQLVDADGWEMYNKDGSQRSAWKSPLFMPREACRLFLEITDVRVERLHDITEGDAIAEGIDKYYKDTTTGALAYAYVDYEKEGGLMRPVRSFQSLWRKINGPESWEANPFVWVVSFKQIKKP